MSLIIPRGPSWTHCTTNMTGTPNSTTPGTGITPGISNADGTTTSLFVLTHDVFLFEISAGGFFIPGNNGSTLLDVMIDPAGGTTWVELIPDLLVGYTVSMAGVAWPVQYSFPVFAPSGANIGVRARMAAAYTPSTTPRVLMIAKGGDQNPGVGYWYGQHVSTIGITPASSKGENHTPGNAG